MTPTPKLSSLPESTSTAVKLLCTRNLHQCLWLPERASHGRLRVTFSTTSNFENQSLPAILFVGPMFGSRYVSLLFDKMARDIGVRVICVDRPGNGGSSPVPLDQRIKIWLETVSVLLDKLNVKHVSLVSHSAGTMYLLSTLYHLRDTLDPVAPFVACLGPWVHFHHSKLLFWNTMSRLPESVISSLPNFNQFVSTKIMPVGSWSGGAISSVKGLFQAEPSSSGAGKPGLSRRYGVDRAVVKEIDRLTPKYIFAEGMAGAAQDALLCLKKSKPGIWGVCDDYQKYVQDFVSLEKGRTSDTDAVKLKFRIYFAETDALIGKDGTKYFDEIWHQDGVSDCIDVQSKIMPDTDHDSVVFSFRKGAIREIFQEIRSITE